MMFNNNFDRLSHIKHPVVDVPPTHTIKIQSE